MRRSARSSGIESARKEWARDQPCEQRQREPFEAATAASTAAAAAVLEWKGSYGRHPVRATPTSNVTHRAASSNQLPKYARILHRNLFGPRCIAVWMIRIAT